LLRDKDQAAQLEQASKVVKSEEAIFEQIQALYNRLQTEPGNISVAKTNSYFEPTNAVISPLRLNGIAMLMSFQGELIPP
jgi:hypothetical protein